MLNLCIDVGNTLIKLAVFKGNELLEFEIFEKTRKDLLPSKIRELHIKNLVYSSVAEAIDEILPDAKALCHLVLNLDQETPIPVINCYETPETLGKDRLAAVVGANSMYPNDDILVIDAGSAITYDIISKNGAYQGGNISPGLLMRFKALHTFTRRLPLVNPDFGITSLGKNTEHAIRNGVQKGIEFEIIGNIEYYKLMYPDLKVIGTGGDLKFFDNKLKNVIFAVPNLVMVGLNQILMYNVK